MRTLRQCLWLLLLWFTAWLQYGVEWAWRVFGSRTLRLDPAGQRADHSESRKPEPWRTDPAWRTYSGREGPTVTVQTSTHAFQADLGRLSEASEYFRALSRSRMRETAESLVHLEHVPSHVFHNLLEFTFLGRFSVPEEELGLHIQIGSYLLVQPFVSECLSSLASVLTPENCEAYLAFAREICCLEMLEAVRRYLSTNLLELAHLTGRLDPEEREELIRLRLGGARRLCALRKENLTSGSQSDTAAARHLYSLAGEEEEEEEGGAWRAEAELPFEADKWCFTTAVLHNYLYLIGGYRHRVRRGYEFKMASFRYNPFTHSWVSTAPLIKHRRHFSAAACEGSVFALGGWYLDSLVAPDSGTALYTAVERYDPWADSWAFVSSLPLTDFRFAVSLSHDVPLATALRRRVYVLGTVQRTGEKLVLQYDVTHKPVLPGGDRQAVRDWWDQLCERGDIAVRGSGRWGRVRATEKMWLAGQGTVLNDQVYMSDVEHNSIVRLDLRSLAIHRLPPFPIHTSYEALFHLHF
ncbi:hypothetical protein ANANG_G00311880 [Anguilla anguilla]|uniref:BTB domain-containing protein n=1 Tax=Anguilla anguilla TaxID=7936 RepID=A0A9D3RHU4_ANGAN|nr:hypothetical protein ANANG_G00311880 [Anguilla anguilla]